MVCLLTLVQDTKNYLSLYYSTCLKWRVGIKFVYDLNLVIYNQQNISFFALGFKVHKLNHIDFGEHTIYLQFICFLHWLTYKTSNQLNIEQVHIWYYFFSLDLDVMSIYIHNLHDHYIHFASHHILVLNILLALCKIMEVHYSSNITNILENVWATHLKKVGRVRICRLA